MSNEHRDPSMPAQQSGERTTDGCPHCEGVTAENDWLRVENARLRVEVRRLRDAQAAIQRVRELHVDHGCGRCFACDNEYPCPTVRALDGDTTEEKR